MLTRLSISDIDPQNFEPVRNFHVNPVAEITDNAAYHTKIGNKNAAFQRFAGDIDRASYISMNPVDMEEHLYESISDSEEANEIVHVKTDSVISTSRETTI